jgi:hypothetical protein
LATKEDDEPAKDIASFFFVAVFAPFASSWFNYTPSQQQALTLTLSPRTGRGDKSRKP